MSDAELREALDGLFAYDMGAVDSGIRDEALRSRCIDELHRRLGKPAGMVWLSRLVRDLWLSEEAIAGGYTIEDVAQFLGWLDARMEVSL